MTQKDACAGLRQDDTTLWVDDVLRSLNGKAPSLDKRAGYGYLRAGPGLLGYAASFYGLPQPLSAVGKSPGS